MMDNPVLRWGVYVLAVYGCIDIAIGSWRFTRVADRKLIIASIVGAAIGGTLGYVITLWLMH